MSGSYRVIRQQFSELPFVTFHIYEVYYKENDKITDWHEFRDEIHGGSLEELRKKNQVLSPRIPLSDT